MLSGRVLLGYSSSYCVSKFAVESFSDGLRYELQPFGISVHLIEPGMYKTQILNPQIVTKGVRKIWDEQSVETKEEYGEEYVDECKCLCLLNKLSFYPFRNFNQVQMIRSQPAKCRKKQCGGVCF